MSDFFSKSDLINSLVEQTREDQLLVKSAVNCLIDHLSNKLADHNRAEIRNFGSFELKSSTNRLIRNPKSGISRLIRSYKRILFRPAKSLKQRVDYKTHNA